MPAIPKWKAPWARSARRCIWCQYEADVAALDIPADTPVAYITQTTLQHRRHQGHHRGAEDALHRHRRARRPPTSATPPRTARPPCANCAKVADVILVVGAKNSSNSNRLREIGLEEGVPSYLIADGSELDPEWVRGKKRGRPDRRRLARPKNWCEHVIEALGEIEDVEVEQMDGKKEHIEFRLPGRTSSGLKEYVMGLPLRQAAKIGAYVDEAASVRRQALSAGADAGAAVPLQSGLRRLRQDRLSRRDPEPAPVAIDAVHGRDRRMRRARRLHRRRRAPAAPRHAAGSSKASSSATSS